MLDEREPRPAGRGGEPSPVEASTSRGIRLGVAAYLLWGLLTIYWKQLDGFDAFELIAWRVVSAGVILAILTTIRQTWPNVVGALRESSTALRLAFAAVLLSVNWASYVWAVTNDRVIETALGYFIAPLATMAIGVFVLDEQPTSGQRLAFVLATVAVVVLTFSYGRPPWVALLIAGTWSVYGLTKRRVSLGAIDSLAGEVFVIFVPAVIALVLLSARDASVVAAASTTEWALVAGTGIATVLPLSLFAAAAKSTPFTVLGPLNLLVPLINFGLGWLLYGEPMPLDRLVGFAFVWAALIVVTWDRVATHRRDAVIAPTA